MKIAPTAQDLVGRFEYHLDFPGNALSPGCSYERWENRLASDGTKPTVYAHVASDPAHPEMIALQYWFFYVFNDFNNLHEGDWEMIQLDFDAATARAALSQDPVAVGYSSHEGAERADWGDDKLELVGGSHPVVYPAAGSHANKYTQALYLGSSAQAGVGCDDTRSPHDELRPIVKTIPSDAAAARRAFPWIDFQGRWGELQPVFFNGPTGPNLKTQWTEPITWSESWRSRSYAVPTGGVFGTRATDFFCTAVATGSRGLIQLIRNPGPTLLVLAALLALGLFLLTRTTWRPSAPLRLARRRHWGQILTAAGRMYRDRWRLFLAIGVLFIPLAAVISLLEAARSRRLRAARPRRHRRVGRGVRAPGRGGRRHADVARRHARSGRDRRRAPRDRRGKETSVRSTHTVLRSPGSVHSRAASSSRSQFVSRSPRLRF